MLGTVRKACCWNRIAGEEVRGTKQKRLGCGTWEVIEGLDVYPEWNEKQRSNLIHLCFSRSHRLQCWRRTEESKGQKQESVRRLLTVVHKRDDAGLVREGKKWADWSNPQILDYYCYHKLIGHCWWASLGPMGPLKLSAKCCFVYCIYMGGSDSTSQGL